MTAEGAVVTADMACPAYLAQGDFVYRGRFVPVIKTSDGVRLVDTEGRCYLDAEAANGSASLGYDGTILAEAVARMGPLFQSPVFSRSS